jgi:hypothetical protein
MGCCGKNLTISRGVSPRIPSAQVHHPGIVYFRYLGRSSITVIGPVTGRAYRFVAGNRVGADPRDAPSLAAVPQVEQVRGL